MTADQRLIAAREFLDAIRPYKVTSRPPSVLVREDAELRRMLGQVLDWVDESVVLDGPQIEVARQALADALEYRTPDGGCPACEAIPPAVVPGDPGRLAPGLCDDHAADLDLTDAYLALGRELGLEVDR